MEERRVEIKVRDGMITKGEHEKISGAVELFWVMIVVETQLYAFVETCKTVHHVVKFIVCKLRNELIKNRKTSLEK